MPRLIPGTRPSKLGVTDGHLRGQSKKPNCVSTESTDPKWHIDPLSYSGEAAAAIGKLADICKAMPRTVVVEQSDDYLYIEFETATLGFVDDVEFYAANNQLQMRSASRVGYSDWNVNRKRLEAITASYNG